MSGTHEPPLSEEVAQADGLRTGWTTGTCASAAARAAVAWAVTGQRPDSTEVALPSGDRVRFPVTDQEHVDPAVADGPGRYRCAVVKDAGDDPDVTDGAHVTADVRVGVEVDAETPDRIALCGGEGVGTVTLPGLGLDVGSPAINPVPRRMIRQAVREVTADAAVVTVSVPGGEQMAAKTSNDRLGIVGGVSILGTTGIVRPFSTASYRASVVQQIDVAAAQGQHHMVLSTGSRSDRAAQRLLADLPSVCFVEVGDFTGNALRRAAGQGLRQVTWVGMAGKIAKLAAGVMMTHYRRSKVDGELMTEVARAHGAPEPVVEAATATATARHFAEACVEHGVLEPLADLCERAARACEAHVDDQLAVDVIMVDFEGAEVLARA